MTELPPSWSRPDDVARAAFWDELRREVAPSHVLADRARRPVRVLARCRHCEMACFALHDGSSALVRLTWSSRAEVPPWPRTSLVRDGEALHRALAAHGDEHERVPSHGATGRIGGAG